MTEFDFEGSGDKPKRGRPAIGSGRKIGGRVPAELATRIDAFAAANFMDFSDAVRELLERGLNGSQK